MGKSNENAIGKRDELQKIDSQEILLSAGKYNMGFMDAQEDNWASSVWRVYYDGAVEYFKNYTLSGESSI